MKKTILTLSTLILLGTYVHADIQPKDGKWKATISSNDVRGCPTMMTSIITKESLKSQTKQVTFSKPFHPNSLFKESKQFQWKEVGKNKWKATMTHGGSGINVNIHWSVDVVSNEKMNIASNVSMILPVQMAAMFGGSSECKADTLGSYNYVSH